MKRKINRAFSLTQRDLAAYLRVSATLLNMSRTGRHGNRLLPQQARQKLLDLELAHQQSAKYSGRTETLKKYMADLAGECSKLAESLTAEANFANARVRMQQRRLEDMAAKEQQDLHWLKTIDVLLDGLEHGSKTGGDKAWLHSQQVVVLQRLKKNGRRAQVLLEIKMEKEKAKAQIYKATLKKLLKQ